MPEDEEAPFNITETTIACPFNDDTTLPIEIGWVDRKYPTLYINAPEVVEHLRAEHNRR